VHTKSCDGHRKGTAETGLRGRFREIGEKVLLGGIAGHGQKGRGISGQKRKEALTLFLGIKKKVALH